MCCSLCTSAIPPFSGKKYQVGRERGFAGCACLVIKVLQSPLTVRNSCMAHRELSRPPLSHSIRTSYSRRGGINRVSESLCNRHSNSCTGVIIASDSLTNNNNKTNQTNKTAIPWCVHKRLLFLFVPFILLRSYLHLHVHMHCPGYSVLSLSHSLPS